MTFYAIFNFLNNVFRTGFIDYVNTQKLNKESHIRKLFSLSDDYASM